ncbi:hypothetical protein F5Y16DRAFT_404634 [Xylariaceae sp. FL0255]|nr:hypothetical protein F5Y16DRAFT_404634 [Xylariaceae sp. FL0255]
MRPNIAAILAGYVFLAPGVKGSVLLMLYQDNHCTIPVPGSGWTHVWSTSCDTNVDTGWTSAQINLTTSPDFGTVTFYNRRNCAPVQPRISFRPSETRCLNDFGFVANAVGLIE